MVNHTEGKVELLKLKCCLIIIWILLGVLGGAVISEAAALSASHHIQIELFPAEMRLTGRNDITIKSHDTEVLEFKLSERATQVTVTVDKNPRDFQFENGRLRIGLKPGEQNGEVRVSVRYSAKFDDPVPIHPVNMDNPGFGVSATISERGSFLLAGAGWYPELLDCRATYRLTVTAPLGLISVTAGRSLGHRINNGKTISSWEVTYPVEGLSLSVARYLVEEKPVDGVMAATYLLRHNKHLAPAYLEATAEYIALFSDLIGPYPFQKFAVVENFFPTGFGFPSYTLMGGSVLRLPFIVRTSLGHEIAHCWWGNGVYVDYSQGNWSEGLTSYVADYRFKETKSPDAARLHRRQWLRNYATIVSPHNDFALNRFQSRYNPITRTIGYDKGAMVFHMLRRILGEEAFWGALQDVYHGRLFMRTSWSDLQQAFEVRGKRSLRIFFEQWVYRKGAPRFQLKGIQAEHTGSTWKVSGQIIQHGPSYRFPLAIELNAGEQTVVKKIEVSGHSTPFDLNCDQPPQQLIADPDDDIFRRLAPSEIPAAVNALKSSPSVVTILTENLEPGLKKAASTLVLSLGLKHNMIIKENELNRQMLAENDILIIGRPRHPDLLKKVPAQVIIRPQSFSLNDRLYDKRSDTFFGVFEHPDTAKRVAALFMPLSSKYADTIARKITHYGKYSYLAFNGGKNQDKGFWPVKTSPLVYRWNQKDG